MKGPDFTPLNPVPDGLSCYSQQGSQFVGGKVLVLYLFHRPSIFPPLFWYAGTYHFWCRDVPFCWAALRFETAGRPGNRRLEPVAVFQTFPFSAIEVPSDKHAPADLTFPHANGRAWVVSWRKRHVNFVHQAVTQGNAIKNIRGFAMTVRMPRDA